MNPENFIFNARTIRNWPGVTEDMEAQFTSSVPEGSCPEPTYTVEYPPLDSLSPENS